MAGSYEHTSTAEVSKVVECSLEGLGFDFRRLQSLFFNTPIMDPIGARTAGVSEFDSRQAQIFLLCTVSRLTLGHPI
jgi:hypothetical protein